MLQLQQVSVRHRVPNLALVNRQVQEHHRVHQQVHQNPQVLQRHRVPQRVQVSLHLKVCQSVLVIHHLRL